MGRRGNCQINDRHTQKGKKNPTRPNHLQPQNVSLWTIYRKWDEEIKTTKTKFQTETLGGKRGQGNKWTSSVAPLLGHTSSSPRSPARSPSLHEPCTVEAGTCLPSHTHIPDMHGACTHATYIYILDAQGCPPTRHTQSLRHARECPSTDTFTLRL